MKLSAWQSPSRGDEGERWAMMTAAEAINSMIPTDDPVAFGTISRDGIKVVADLWAATNEGLGHVVVTNDTGEGSPVQASITPWAYAPAISLHGNGFSHDDPLPLSLQVGGGTILSRPSERDDLMAFFYTCLRLAK